MMETKFRVWDKERKEYLSGGAVFIEIPKGSRPSHNAIYLDVTSGYMGVPDRYRKRFVIEQFTTRKDKNGVELFKGDIIDLGEKNSLSHWPKFVEVSWSPDGYWLYWACFGDCKIIGNIHQNPELLDPQVQAGGPGHDIPGVTSL